MKLSTPVSINKSDFTLSHEQPILLFGSCFAQSIGEKLSDYKFDVDVNPNGIIYNPISVFKGLKRIIKNNAYSDNELSLHKDKWISFNHHGSFSSLDKSDCLSKINSTLAEAFSKIEQSKTIFITFGSAWVYEYTGVGIVANCHKIPNKEFSKRLLTVKEILAAFNELKEELKGFDVVFTVSPVRHVKDGLYENNLSKSTLHLAINNLVEQNGNCHYFPAYEMVIDELRDYRFYKDDLVHPTNLAVDYVWGKFGECYFNKETQQLNIEINKIKTALNHKPFNKKGEYYQNFVAKTAQQISALKEKHPFLEF